MVVDSADLDAASAYKLLIGSIIPRAVAWVSTLSRDGVANLAPISFFTAVGRKPPMVSLSLQPKSDGVTLKDTFLNIRESGEFVTNLVTLPQAQQMHRTAFEFESGADEFEETGLEKAACVLVRAPRIEGAPISLECVVDRIIPMGDLGDHVVWGEVVRFHIADELYLERGRVDTGAIPAVGRLAGEYTFVDNAFVPPLEPATLASRKGRRMVRLDGRADGYSPLDTKAWSASGSTMTNGSAPAPERVPETDVTLRRHGDGDRAVVFVNDVLDDQHVWDAVVDELHAPGVECIQLDLAGCGERADAIGPFTYERLARDVGAVVDAIGKPFTIVGQSMGAPVAELVAAARPERAIGLVLVSPVPLAGARLPDEAVAPFRALGGDLDAQRAVRQQLSVASAYAGPMLIVRGAGDGVVTDDVVSARVAPRFPSAQTVTIEHAGHWPHVEQPAALAAELDRFLTRHGAGGNTAVEVHARAWTVAFADQSAASFAEALAENVVLEASVLRRPIEGRRQVKQAMAAASGLYESLVFVREATNGRRTYLEWEATAFGGTAMRGVTVLTKDGGQIVHAAIHHRPLDAALRFSAALGKRLRGAIDPIHFHDGD
jgi:flavin reductase (DIM6/NTAB) family NADH-FMN oxidoreductase RutF/pimeloyl-ACP methyl ester carboxylesterase